MTLNAPTPSHSALTLASVRAFTNKITRKNWGLGVVRYFLRAWNSERNTRVRLKIDNSLFPPRVTFLASGSHSHARVFRSPLSLKKKKGTSCSVCEQPRRQSLAGSPFSSTPSIKLNFSFWQDIILWSSCTRNWNYSPVCGSFISNIS